MMVEDKIDRLLRPDDVAERLAVSRSEAYRLIRAGKIRSVAIDEGRGQLRVRLSDLNTYITNLPSREGAAAR